MTTMKKTAEEAAPRKKRGRKPSVLGPAATAFEKAQAKVAALEARRSKFDALLAQITDAEVERDARQAELQAALDASANAEAEAVPEAAPAS